MADVEESPAQKQARLRRERREAKIKAGGSARLDKILNSSGRPADSVHDTSPSPAASPAIQPQAAQTPPLRPPPLAEAADPAQLQTQEEFLRSIMKSNPPGAQEQSQTDDPTMRLLESILGSAGGADGTQPGAPPISPEDLSSMTGLPSFATKTFTDMFFGKPPPTPEAQRREAFWNVIHVLFAFVAGFYMLFTVQSSARRWGKSPPPPATVQNPFVIFLMGELLVEGGKMIQMGTEQRRGFLAWFQILRDIWRDACVAVFILGAGQWFSGIEMV